MKLSNTSSNVSPASAAGSALADEEAIETRYARFDGLDGLIAGSALADEEAIETGTKSQAIRFN